MKNLRTMWVVYWVNRSSRKRMQQSKKKRKKSRFLDFQKNVKNVNSTKHVQF